MRIRKDSIRGRVKADLPIVFTDGKLSAYGGIELFRRFVDRSGFAERLKQVFSIRQFDGDYGSFRITLALTTFSGRFSLRRSGTRCFIEQCEQPAAPAEAAP